MRHNAAVPNYRHAWLALYALCYLPLYVWLERRSVHYHVVEAPLDRIIPFAEGFVVFYLGWFVFMALGILYVALTNQAECYRLGAVLIIGMTLSCLIYYFYPTVFPGRPFLHDSNPLFGAVGLIYALDTPTNVFPSIHVYNTLALLIAIFRCQTLKEHRGLLFSRRTLQKAAASQNFAGTLPFAAFAGEVRWRRIGLVLVTMAGALIILSTVFIKQHSILDAFGAAALLALIAFGVYWVFPRVFLRV